MNVRVGSLRATALVLGLGLAVAACGSSKSGTAPAAQGTNKASGSPITVMTISPSGTNSANFPDISTVLDAYASTLNANGGVAGHPLTVEYCNDQNDPNAATTCARKAVSDKVMAVVGSFTQFGDQVVPVLAAANIPWLASNAISATEYSSPDSYPLVPGPFGVAAISAKAGSECTKTDYITFDVPAAAGLAQFVSQGLAAAHKTIDKTVKVPVTTTDYSSIVSAAKDADCIVVALPEQAVDVYLAKAKSLDITQKVFAPGGALGSTSLKQFPTQLEGSYTVSSYPTPDNAVWQPLKASLAAAGKSSVDLTVPENLNAWVAATVFTKVAATLTTFDGPSLKSALDKTASLDTGGFTPVLNFTKPLPIPALARLFDTSLIGVDVKNGAFVQDGTFVDYAASLKG